MNAFRRQNGRRPVACPPAARTRRNPPGVDGSGTWIALTPRLASRRPPRGATPMGHRLSLSHAFNSMNSGGVGSDRMSTPRSWGNLGTRENAREAMKFMLRKRRYYYPMGLCLACTTFWDTTLVDMGIFVSAYGQHTLYMTSNVLRQRHSANNERSTREPGRYSRTALVWEHYRA